MIHSLETNLLHVEINERGAELSSIFSKNTKTEYLWQGNPAIWGQRAPVLFPIVGRLKDGKYSYSGKTYEMPPHGFVSSAPFATTGVTDNSIVFTYEDTKETRAMYPFSFTLRVIFTLKWNVLETIYQVINKTNGPMYFSCGSHEGYRCPWIDGENFNDYYLEFDHDNTYSSLTVSENGLMTEPNYPVLENEKRLNLDYGLFDKDSLVFADIPSGKVILGSAKNQSKIEISYDDAPNLVLWTQKDAPYICIEPWHGLPDYEDSDGELTNKKGIITLEKGGVYSRIHQISIYEPRSTEG